MNFYLSLTTNQVTLNQRSNFWKFFANRCQLLKTTCKENKLKEFHFKFIHRITVTKKELCRFGIKDDDECLYCGDPDSIDHSFIHCHFTKVFITNVIEWFNNLNNTHFSPSSEETLFGMLSGQLGKKLLGSLIHPFIYAILYLYS